jgi:hypothetical protein
MTIATDTCGWVITRDYYAGDSGHTGRVGYGQGITDAAATDATGGRRIQVREDWPVDAIPRDKAIRWRSFSDDGDRSYDGFVHLDWLMGEVDGEGDLAFNIDRFVMADVGDTVVLYSAVDLKRVAPEYTTWADNHPKMNRNEWDRRLNLDNWLPIYG